MNDPAIIGQNPLTPELQDKVYELVSYINKNYNKVKQLCCGIILLYSKFY